MSTEPREPKNGHTNASRISTKMILRCTEEWVRRSASLVWGIDRACLTLPPKAKRSRTSCQTNMATAHAAMIHRVIGLAPLTCRPMPTTLSFRPRTG
ncbi:hypothetical protein D9M68_342920 [compost metagenome]